MAMSGPELRQLFLDYFREKGHLVVPSSSLIPHGDPTLLLTSAGMVQFKPYFMGEASPPAPRLTSCQKCFRTTDIESVGNERNLTFFEMLGNFSIGDYFKEGAIAFAWEFVTQRLKIPAERIWVTIYPEDDEAETIWRSKIGLPAERIVRHEENWWGPAGSSGPCGPDSELYLDRGVELGCGSPTCAPGCACPRFLEFWNLVFMEFYQDEAGTRTPLPRKNIDTGMGLERLAMIHQGVATVYDTDLFRPIIEQACVLTGKRFGESPESDFSLRVIADHSRAVTFLIADGVLPGNEGRGYILRRILRRAVRHGRRLGLDQPFLVEACRTVIELFGVAYPELIERRAFIERVVHNEEAKFRQTLQLGLAVLDEAIADLMARGETVIPGEIAFRLHDTYGFPRELTSEVAREHGLTIDEAGFEAAMERQREQARAAHRIAGPRVDVQVYQQLVVPTCTFVGYERLDAETTITALLAGEHSVVRVGAGDEVEIVLRETPFYSEGGGQVGDTGWILGPHGRAQVLDTQRPLDPLIVHRARVTEGWLEVGETVRAKVDAQRRLDIMRNHTATHLLHRALRDVLGTHVQQAGSLVAPDRLRFDFTHLAPLTDEERVVIERSVNERIREAMAVSTSITTYQEAVAAGAMAFFGDKYGATVRMVSVGDFSRELCGGTHVSNTGQIGLFLLVSETGIGAGLRRVEALTGRGAEEYVRSQLHTLERVSTRLGGGDMEARLESLLAELQQVRRQVHELQRRISHGEVERLLAQAQEVDGLRVISGDVHAPDRAALLELGDELRRRLERGVIVLGSIIGEKPAFVAMVTPGAGVHAGQLIRQVAAIAGGSGGGKPEVAQAGGKDPQRMPEALRAVPALVADLLKR